MEKYVIAISRCCGGNGSAVGKLLSERLGIELYDNNLLTIASEQSGISRELFENADEKVRNSLLFKVSKRVYRGELIPPDSSEFTSDKNLFNYQAKVLKELAKEESFVVVGRGGDFILRDHPRLVKLFITAPHDVCVSRMMEIMGFDEKEAEALIAQRDKGRGESYRYYTGGDWLDMRNYDMCLNTASLSYEDCVEQIVSYMKLKFGEF